jgi:hypothetical protein
VLPYSPTTLLFVICRDITSRLLGNLQIPLEVDLLISLFVVSKPAYRDPTFVAYQPPLDPHVGGESLVTEEYLEQLDGTRRETATAEAEDVLRARKQSGPERCFGCGRSRDECEELVKAGAKLSYCGAWFVSLSFTARFTCADCTRWLFPRSKPVQRHVPFCSRCGPPLLAAFP